MSNEERIKKYKEKICVNCNNQNKGQCNIKITAEDEILKIKCSEYERKQVKDRNIKN